MTQMNDVTGRTTPPTVPEREKAGHEARERTPIASLGTYTSGSDRPDPLTLLESQSESRVPFLVPVRYGRMLVSPFTFYRGAALIMASDLSSGPRTDLQAQLCGDAHLANFGGFATPERRLIFDINDFDETNPGPFEWDVKRLAASMEVAARDHGFKKKERAEIVRSTAEAYRTTMAELATQGRLDVWYATLDMDATLDKYRAEMKADELKRTGATIAKARTRTSLQAANKLTTVVNGQRRFIDNPPVVERAETLLGNAHFDMAAVAAALQQSWADYEIGRAHV